MLQTLFKNLVLAYAEITKIASEVNKGERQIKQLEKPTGNMVNMFPNAKSVNATSVSKHIEQLAASAATSDFLFTMIGDINYDINVLTDLTTLDSVLDKYLQTTKAALRAFRLPESGGKQYVVKGLDALEKEKDVIKACALVKDVHIEVVDTVTDNIENANIFHDGNELKSALTAYLKAFHRVEPTYLHKVESLASTVGRDAKLNGMKIKTKWGEMLDKLPEADRETVRPYIAAVTEMARLSSVLGTKILRASVRQYAEAVFAAAKYFNAVTEKAK